MGFLDVSMMSVFCVITSFLNAKTYGSQIGLHYSKKIVILRFNSSPLEVIKDKLI